MLICSCSLLPGDPSPGGGGDEALDTIQRPVQGDPAHLETRASLVGTLQSSLYKLRPIYGAPGSLETYFIFSDVAVRVTGNFRLKITLVEAYVSITSSGELQLTFAMSGTAGDHRRQHRRWSWLRRSRSPSTSSASPSTPDRRSVSPRSGSVASASSCS